MRRVALIVSAALAVSVLGCRKSENVASEAEAVSAAEPVVREDTAGLLFTWTDEKGEFHVGEKVSEVPLVGRDAVRVMDPAVVQAGGELFIADLRVARPDGTYAVRRMTRAEFDALAVSRRQKHNPTMPNAPGSAMAAPAGSAPAHAAESPAGDTKDDPAVRPAVILYGASWCGACREAAAYFKRKGVPFVEKDIEADPSADREMRIKLGKARLRGGSIPVLDVRGTVMVGFDPQRVEAALGGQAL